MKVKFLAMYLPQFHSIPENDEFWGKGFTDWVSVKKAKPLFAGHYQPKEPSNDWYYDLSKKEDIERQVKLANEYGVNGFGIYHYWFNNEKNLLTKPAEIIRENTDININYFFCWDNNSWVRSWSNVDGNAWAVTQENPDDKNGPRVLVQHILGGEKDWEKHYNEVVKYFKDERYIKIDGKPLFQIITHRGEMEEMCDYWNQLAIRDGFKGVHFMFKSGVETHIPKKYLTYHYEPIFAGWGNISLLTRVYNKILRTLKIKRKKLKVLSYDKVWEKLLRTARNCNDSHQYHGAFVSYDDTPRRGQRGIVINGSTPEKFKSYLKRLADISKIQNKEYIFVTAWNEWGEGAYLEPDKVNGLRYLEAIKEVEKSLNLK